MDIREKIAVQIGNLVLANIEMTDSIERLQNELRDSREQLASAKAAAATEPPAAAEPPPSAEAAT